MFRVKNRLKGWKIGALILFCDGISKFLTQAFIPLASSYSPQYPYGGIGVFQNFLGIEFSIVHATNRGAAWSTFAEFQYSLLALRMILIIGIVIYALFLNKNPRWQIPLTLIIFGAIGNVIDFFLYGHVVDMFHFVFWGYDYPVFNIADSTILIGVAWLFIASWKRL